MCATESTQCLPLCVVCAPLDLNASEQDSTGGRTGQARWGKLREKKRPNDSTECMTLAVCEVEEYLRTLEAPICYSVERVTCVCSHVVR